MYFKQENHQNSNESLRGLSLHVCPCAQVSLVCALGHTCALPDRALQEGAEKGAGVALSQMLSHCTRFLQLGLTQSVQGMCLFRVSHEKEAPKVGAATEGVERESRSRENVFTGGHKLTLCHVHLLFPVSDK